MNANLLRTKFINKELTLKNYYAELIERIESKKDYNIYLTLNGQIDQVIAYLQNKLDKGHKPGKLFGLPISIKDNISTKGLRTTCGSKVLQDFVPIYDATVIRRILDEDGVIVGKVNMDEFAMGSSSETSYFGPSRNPLDYNLVPGGSSSGSAASVAADLAIISLGTDTGGSVRQPSSYCSVIGYMPSYGTISRYGVVSMSNTLDEVGIVAKSVEDILLMLQVVGGEDSRDMTTIRLPKVDYQLSDEFNLKGIKLGIVDNLADFDIQPIVMADYQMALKELETMGCEMVSLTFPHLKYASSVYNVVMASEVSSNMARFDGIRYGYLSDHYLTTKELYIHTRSESFGEEVQRRIAMGTHYLAAENNQATYKQGLKVRTLIRQDFQEAFQTVDAIVTPTVTDTPYPIGSRIEDPLVMYDSGAFNVPVNLSGLCAISLPVREGIGGSVQFIGNRHKDELLLNIANQFERRER